MNITDINKLKYIAELGVLTIIPNFLKEPLKPGRLRNAFFEVEHLVNKELTKLRKEDPTFFQNNKSAISYYLNEFSKKATNVDKNTHVATMVSFCLAFLKISKHKYPKKLFENLNKILDYFERNNVQFDNFLNMEDFQEDWESIEDYPVLMN